VGQVVEVKQAAVVRLELLVKETTAALATMMTNHIYFLLAAVVVARAQLAEVVLAQLSLVMAGTDFLHP
jgi:hypothetical protein